MAHDPGDQSDNTLLDYRQTDPQTLEAARAYVTRVAPDLLDMLGLTDTPTRCRCAASHRKCDHAKVTA